MTPVLIRFSVPGKPATKGSVKLGVSHAGKPYLRQANANERSWRHSVGFAALAGMRAAGIPGSKIEGAVSVHITCYFVRPESADRDHPHVKPDVDKITRSALDALTGIVYRDDAQVTELRIKKRYGASFLTEFVIMEDE